MEINETAFEHLPLARTALPEMLTAQYRVYRDASSFTLIAAESALKALELSGFSHAYKIQRTSMMMNNLITPDYWEMDASAKVSAAIPAEKAEAVPAFEPEPAPESEALSNHDVNKLLSS